MLYEVITKAHFPIDEKSGEPQTLGWFGDGDDELLAAITFRSAEGGGLHGKNCLHLISHLGVDDAWRDQALAFLRTLRDQYVEAVLSVPADDLWYHRLRT